jgi:hypothetical protein
MDLGGLLKLGVADAPFVTLPTLRTTRQDALVADAKQGIEFALDPRIDDLTGLWAIEMQPFHSGLLLDAALRTLLLPGKPAAR